MTDTHDPNAQSVSAELTHYVWRIAIAAALGGLLFGYDWVVIGGAREFYERYFHLTSTAVVGWTNSCALLGCLIGSLAAGYPCRPLRTVPDSYGVICLLGFFFVASYVPETRGQSLEQIESRLTSN